MSTIGEVMDVIRESKEQSLSQREVAALLTEKQFENDKGTTVWASHDVSRFARKRGVRWKRKYRHNKTEDQPIFTTTSKTDWINYLQEISASNLNSGTKSLLMQLLVRENA